MGFKEKYIKDAYKNELARTEAIEKAYELLMIPDMYNAIDGCFDNDAEGYLERALGGEKSKEIRGKVRKFFGEERYN